MQKDVVTALRLFDSLIKSILLYNRDFWGGLKLPKNNPVENLQMRVFKEVLGVSRKTTNVGVLLELGRTPLHIEAISLCVKNWERIRKGEANDNISRSCSEASELNLPWNEGIQKNL